MLQGRERRSIGRRTGRWAARGKPLALAFLIVARAAEAEPWPTARRSFASPAEIEETAAAFPESSQMQRRRLASALERGDAEKALDSARRLAAMGAVLSKALEQQLAAAVPETALRPLLARFEANARPVARSRFFASVPAAHGLVEGLAWSPVSRRFYATSVSAARVLRLASPSEASALPAAGLAGAFGAAVETRSGRIWVASAPIELGGRTVAGFRGVAGLSERGGAVRWIPAPEGSRAVIGDVTVAGDGTLYASDGQSGEVFACRPGCTSLASAVPAGRLFGAQGMVASSDGRRLYIADYRYGIAVLDRRSGDLRRLVAGPGVMLDGIDGLAADGADLIAVQNAWRPVRIVRIVLSPGGTRVRRVEVLERANPSWGEPSLGVVAGRNFYYVADAQWDRFGDKPRPPKATPIHVLPLGRARGGR